MERRKFIRNSFLSGAALATAGQSFAENNTKDEFVRTQTLASPTSIRSKPFNMDYAIHDGMFKNLAGDNFLDQIQFAYDNGFRAIEDNGMRKRDAATQKMIGEKLAKLNMKMGVLVAHDIDWQKPSLTTNDKAIHEKFLEQIKESIDVARRCSARWMVVVPGVISHNINLAYQKARVMDTLRKAADILAPHNLTFLLEPLNFRDHPGQVLPDIPNIYEMVKSINSPACKMLFDVYHVQIHTGNLIPNIDLAWDETVYIQLGDNPGRKEPGTGEINYKNIFLHLDKKGYKGLLGMEHGNSIAGKDGELALIKAYREADSFK